MSLAAVSAGDWPDTESFGLDANGNPPSGGTAWGLFLRDILAAVAWFEAPPSGPAKILALAIPPRRWKLGLTTWMLSELAKTVPGREVDVVVAKGGRALGDALEEAEFKGPHMEEEGYPAGTWVKGNNQTAINN